MRSNYMLSFWCVYYQCFTSLLFFSKSKYRCIIFTLLNLLTDSHVFNHSEMILVESNKKLKDKEPPTS